jgi:hypothetical protein
MSKRDYIENKDALLSFIGRKCFLSLACNSIKLHIDENKVKGTYVWIDPPWQYGKGDEEIESSLSCPVDDEIQIQEWFKQFDPIWESRIENIVVKPDGEMWIHFQNDYAFFVPKEFIPDDDSWYDHWYINKEKAEPEP